MHASAKLALFLLALLLSVSLAEAEVCKPGEKTVTAFGRPFAPSITLNNQHWNTAVPHGIPSFKSSATRLLFKAKADASDRDWAIVVRDPALRALAILHARDFEDKSGRLGQARWTGRLPAATVHVDLIASKLSDAEVEIAEGIALPSQSTEVRLFSIQGATPKWQPIYRQPSMVARRTGDIVALLVAGSAVPAGAGDALSWCCTGVMIASDLLLTNWHCGGTSQTSYWNPDVCGRALIDLGWDDGLISRQYNCVDVVAKNERLDFAIIRVRPVIGAGGAAGTPRSARIAAIGVSKNDSLFVVHHAQCQPKLVSADCHVVATRRRAWIDSATSPTTLGAGTAPDFTHDCDTEPGASGAPVFDSQGRLVGLHHTGFDLNEQCEPTDRVNKSVRMDEIVAYLRDIHPALLNEIGVD